MKIIDVLIRNAGRRAARNSAVRRISHRFWRQIEDKGYDITIVGDRKAVRELLGFADTEQRKRVSRIIGPNQIEKLVPGLKSKKDGMKDGVDLIVIPHQDHKESISDTVRKHMRHSIPVYTLFEDQLISYRISEQIRTIDIDRQLGLPEKTYIVASSRRTGSTMLCDFLQGTGVLGYPNEYIREALSVMAQGGIINPGYVLKEALKVNQTKNGVFGIKIHWSALESFNKSVFPKLDIEERKLVENLLKNSAYIFLTRRNKIRQAISDWRALGTGIFHIRKDSKDRIRKQYESRLPYDYTRLKRLLADLVRHDEGWRTYFETNDIHPVEIVYEDLVKRPEEEVRRILDYLLEDCANIDVAPDTNRLSDEYTEEIYGQFVKDLVGEYGKDMVMRLEGVEPVKDVSVRKGRSKNHVLVTLATRDYIDMAKQLFSSAYFNGGWDGDYLLLAHDITDEELSWFRERGIIIRHTAPLYEGQPGGMHPCLADKLHMFTPAFRKWRTVIYSDLDVIIKESLDGLKEVEGFWAVEDWSPTLTDQIVNDADIKERGLVPEKCREVIRRLEQRYEVSRRPFCAGFFAFSTDIITDNMFTKLKETMDEYRMVSKYGDQLSLNLFFYEGWKKLSHTYNVLVAQEAFGDSYSSGAHTRWGVAEDVNAYVLHMFNPKPWVKQSDYHWEWLVNLKRADQTCLCKVDKDFEAGIKNIERAERRIRLMEKTHEIIDRFIPFKGTAISTLRFAYWRYVTLRRIMRFIVANTDSRFIRMLWGI